MSTKVVSTKLTEEEHNKLLDACNKRGCTPSVLIKEAIMEKIQPEEPKQEKPETPKRPLTLRELLKRSHLQQSKW